jgi:hypothetical protein
MTGEEQTEETLIPSFLYFPVRVSWLGTWDFLSLVGLSPRA